MAEPQSPPLNPDESYVPATWAESGAATEPAAGRKDTGFLPGGVDTPPADDWNWPHQTALRYARVIQGRSILSSDGLSSSWMPPSNNGQWSTNGVGALQGFLSNGPASPDSRVANAFLDPDADGSGVRMQIRVAKAAPATFVATRDTFVFVPIDTVVGGIAEEPELTLLDVPIGNPAPAAPAGTVLVWRVETDGATIVDQEILLPRFPVFQMIGVVEFSAVNFQISGDADIAGDLTVNGNVNLGDNIADTVGVAGELGVIGDLDVLGSSTLGDSAGDTTDVNGLLTANDGLTVSGGTLLTTAPLQADGNVTLGDAAGDAIAVNGTSQFNAPVTFADDIALASTKTMTLTGSAAISGGTSSSVTTGTLSLVSGAPAPASPGDMAVNNVNEPLVRTDDGLFAFFFGSQGPWVEVNAEQVSATALAATTFVTTGDSASGVLEIEVSGQVQRSAVGDVLISLEQDQGIATWVTITNDGVGTITLRSVDNSVASDWTPFTLRRTIAVGLTDTFFRLNLDGNASTARLRETYLKVRRQGTG